MNHLLLDTDSGLWQYLLAVGGGVLVIFAVARLMSEKKQPMNTVAWLLAIVLIPWVGVPAYLLFGGRKLRKLAGEKSRIEPLLPSIPSASSREARSATAQIVANTGLGPAFGGNKIQLITTGEQAFSEMEAQIRAAQHSIHITTFILARDETGKRIIKLLCERARAGVKVRLLLDSVGCLFSSQGFCNPLRESGGEVCSFMPVFPFFAMRSSANLRNHRKIAVFDRHTAIVGGHNLAREYMGPSYYRKRWRDFGAVIRGPGAALLNEVFLADWTFASGKDIEKLHNETNLQDFRAEGTSEMQVVASGPDVKGDPLYEAILSLIQEAEKSIWIVTPYFIPDEVLLRSLMVKARAGKEVVVIVPLKSNHPITDYARRHYLRELQSAGAHVRFYAKGMLHSKAMVVDDHYALLGSANFDLRSLFVNFEIGVLLYTSADVKAIKAWARDLLKHCHPPGPEEKGRRKIVAGIAEDLSRLLAPML